jgi:hypothetical protein
MNARTDNRLHPRNDVTVGAPPCDATPRQGVSDLVRGIRAAAAVGDGQTVVDSTRRLCAVVHARGRFVRDAASSARRWDQTVRGLPVHLQREVRRAYLAYAELSCKISERDDPGRRRARAGASHMSSITVGDEERRLAGALSHVRTATERHLGAYFDTRGPGAVGDATPDAADIAVLEQSPPRKRARVVAAAVRAMGTETCDRDESEPASQPGDAPDEPMR